MTEKAGNIVLLLMVAGAVLGALGGLFAGEFFLKIEFIGALFLNSLMMVVIPLVVASMIVGVTSLGDLRRIGRTGAKTMIYFLFTTSMAVTLGLVLVNIMKPGAGITAWQTELPDIVSQSEGKGIADVFLSLIPRNLFKAAADGDILPLIVFSLLFGGVLTAIGEKGKVVISFFEGVNLAIMEIVHLIIYIAPIGVMSIIGAVVAKNAATFDQLVAGLGKYSLTVLLGLFIHGFIILPTILKFLGRQDPFKFVVNMGKPLATAFATASSSATLPLNMEAAIEKNKLDSRVVQFVLPLGATVNMNGTALYQAVAALFIAQISGIDLTIGQQIIVLFTATLAAVGAAGIPHAGTVMMVTILHAVNLPVTGIGLIFAVDWFLDRCRTTVNVFDDAVAAAVIARTKEFRQ